MIGETARTFRTTVRLATAAAILALVSTAARPASAQSAAAGRIGGRVVMADARQSPVRGALVTIAGGGISSHSTVTDDSGAFLFDAVPAGRFTLTATKPAYIPAAFGASQPGRPGTALTLAAGEVRSDVVISMARGGVIAGTVRDAKGTPLPGVQVAVARMDTTEADAPVTVFSSDIVTDDRGMYRTYGLEPGDYLVAASLNTPGAQPMEILTSAEMDAAFQNAARSSGEAGPLAGPVQPPPTQHASDAAEHRGAYAYTAIFHPATPDAALARPIVIGPGDDREGVDITFTPVPTATVDGFVTGGVGPTSNVRLSLSSAVTVTLPPFFVAAPRLTRPPDADGHFTFTGVPPGVFTLNAQTEPARQVTTRFGDGTMSTAMRTPSADELSAPVLWARTELTVAGDDISGVALALQPAPRLRGRVTFDGEPSGAPASWSGRVVLTPARQDFSAMQQGPGGFTSGRVGSLSSTIAEDGGFNFRGVLPNTYDVNVVVPAASAWRLRSVMANGQDLLDHPLTITGGEGDLEDVVVTFTDRHTTLTGVLQTPTGAPATDYYVVAFSTDRSMWRRGSRRLAFARPASDGAFLITDLPPGDYHLAALADLDPHDWERPDLLDQIVPASLPVTVTDGGRTVQSLRIAR